MQFTDLRIVFMGTPEFAVASLEALVNAGGKIVGVITAPDKPAGRGMKLTESAVKKYAIEKGLLILQPEKLKDPTFLASLKALKADVQVVVAFRMLPEVVWNMPPMGTINLHGSLLPQYRGAAPIHWAVINGEKETGVTTFKLKHEIDTGDIYLQEKFEIGENETTGEIHDRMKLIGANLLVKTIQSLANATIKPLDQNTCVPKDRIIHHAPKLFSETCKIDWNQPAQKLHNLVRGLSPFPGAFTYVNNKLLKIYQSSIENTKHSLEIGSIHSDGKTYYKFACMDGFIQVKDLQWEGKKRMLIEEYLRGLRS